MSEEHVHGPDCDHGHDDGSLELISVRLVGEELHCSLLTEVFKDDPASWGIVLADLARNIAEATAPKGGGGAKLLQEIRDNFLAALEERPDDTPEE